MRPNIFVILIALLAAYLLGARAGRERYEQITGSLASFWNAPDVKKARKKAQAQAEKARKRYA
ncbi:hypothetical protein [Leifsonia xyli]|uniref:hypothetical protein n=1 Tax=Leifsonia xyli TaxID=1575 RepID=UPI003D672476